LISDIGIRGCIALAARANRELVGALLAVVVHAWHNMAFRRRGRSRASVSRGWERWRRGAEVHGAPTGRSLAADDVHGVLCIWYGSLMPYSLVDGERGYPDLVS